MDSTLLAAKTRRAARAPCHSTLASEPNMAMGFERPHWRVARAAVFQRHRYAREAVSTDADWPGVVC